MAIIGTTPKLSTKKVVERLALEAETTAWNTQNENEFNRMIERLTTLNQIAMRLCWYEVNARIQKAIDRLLDADANQKSVGDFAKNQQTGIFTEAE